MSPVPSWILREHSTNANSAYQREPEAFRHMVNNHHPLAAEYTAARQAYDQLPFAAEAGYRYFSAIDDFNYSIVSAPVIGISDEGGQSAHNCLLEAHQDNETYRWQAACEATAGWLNCKKYFLNYGEWIILTENPDFMREAQALGMQVTSLLSYHLCKQLDCDAEKMAAIQQLISRYHAGHLLLPRQVPLPIPIAPLETLCDQIPPGKDAWL